MAVPARRDGSDGLPLLAYGALHGPDADLRRRLRDGLESWARQVAPKWTVKEALKILGSTRGTPIEPFDLSEGDTWLASLLVRVTLGGAVPAVRLQGRDNIGTQGGLVVTKEGESRFSERLATGTVFEAPVETTVFRPSHFIDAEALRLQRVAPCRLAHTATGLQIYLGPVPHEPKLSLFGETPKATSVQIDAPRVAAPMPVGPWGRHPRSTPPEPLGIHGLSVSAPTSSGTVQLQARTPESILRLSALLAGESVVAVHAPEDNDRYALLVRFTSQDAEAHPLPAVSSRPLRALERWLEPRAEVALPSDFPSHADRVALSEWLAPPTPWLTEKLLEELL